MNNNLAKNSLRTVLLLLLTVGCGAKNKTASEVASMFSAPLPTLPEKASHLCAALRSGASGISTKEIILHAIKEKPTCNVKELAELCGISSAGIQYHINNLKKSGLIRHVGATKTGQWEVLT